ncbi:MAG: type IV secretory system conjugative DNA transfer family protein, partial [Conexibacteraceae bacterium]|nr:type IV secretory system conjugative DNA transfer family protein [Conexibacteraceae bacterium]
MNVLAGRREEHSPISRGTLATRDGGDWAGPLLANVQAMNKPVLVPPRDWPAGILVIGAQGSGKSSVMTRVYQNALLDRGAAVVLIDPKRTLARRALALTPPWTGKRVWYLNLARPAFGMSPLRIGAPDQAIADLVTSGLRDVFEGQIFQASRDAIDGAVRGALALAHHERRPASLEDTRDLLLWANGDLRDRVVRALDRTLGADRTHQYFAIELPDEMKSNVARTMDRLRAPRNKLDGLINAESLRVFFHHKTEKPIAEIVRDRDVLIVDADLGKAGEENSELVIAFILRMLSQTLREQMDLEEHERSRVHLLIDESAQVLRESTIEMFEQHREGGLTAAIAAHYTAQFGDERVLAGVLALLANRFMFRSADPEDGEKMAKIARAVLAATRDTPESRARQRVGPEAI